MRQANYKKKNCICTQICLSHIITWIFDRLKKLQCNSMARQTLVWPTWPSHVFNGQFFFIQKLSWFLSVAMTKLHFFGLAIMLLPMAEAQWKRRQACHLWWRLWQHCFPSPIIRWRVQHNRVRYIEADQGKT